MRIIFLLLIALPLLATPVLDWRETGLVTPGLHPNYDVALPLDLTNRSGLTLAELESQFPQSAFAFNGRLVGYFDPNRPAAIPHWTVEADSSDPLPTPEPGTIIAGLVAAAFVTRKMTCKQ